MTPLMYPAEEAAEYLRLGLSTVRALIKSGELRSVKIGHLRRIPADALHEYVQRLDAEQNGTPTTGPATEPYRHLVLGQNGDGVEVAASTPSVEAPNAIRL
ncbi:helix-turn-helix domain-containing protein [Streptomyces sp. ME08-AFT2]|uniref:helix-turn-helix domain-containing protein n=1 Tax=Streptomyces sp. ME08-AFT2 TaxID=3028683 RepID=UPI0029C07987|nr:helix-turn-helix domain-containing protein [Streptomyces sp. ME08-AFT2]